MKVAEKVCWSLVEALVTVLARMRAVRPSPRLVPEFWLAELPADRVVV